MLTILNIINYLVGKPLSLYMLILATILIYYYVLSYHWDTFYNNKLYLIIITIVLLMDITMIILTFDNSELLSQQYILKGIYKGVAVYSGVEKGYWCLYSPTKLVKLTMSEVKQLGVRK